MAHNMNVEDRVHAKVMEYGEDAILHFTEDEVIYYQNHILPLCGDYLICLRLAEGMRRDRVC
jgi:hypothetical protein